MGRILFGVFCTVLALGALATTPLRAGEGGTFKSDAPAGGNPNTLNSLKANQKERQQFARRNDRAIHDGEEMSARARGLGGVYGALSNGAAGIYENPAALGAMMKHETTGDWSYDSLNDDDVETSINQINVGGAVNLNHINHLDRASCGNHSFGIAYHRTGFDYDGLQGQEQHINGVTVAYGRSLLRGRVFVGGSFGWRGGKGEDDQDLWDHEYDRYEFKLGSIYRHNRQLAFGGTILVGVGSVENDAGYDITDGDAVNVAIRGGLSYQMTSKMLLASDLSFQYLAITDSERNSHHKHNITRFGVGGEYLIFEEKLTGRAGAYYERDNFHGKNTFLTDENDDQAGFTFGFSAYWKALELSHAFDVSTRGDIQNTIKLGAEF